MEDRKNAIVSRQRAMIRAGARLDRREAGVSAICFLDGWRTRFASPLRVVGGSVLVILQRMMLEGRPYYSFRGYTAEVDPEFGHATWSPSTCVFEFDLLREFTPDVSDPFALCSDDVDMCELALEMNAAITAAASRPWVIPTQFDMPQTILAFPEAAPLGFEATPYVVAYATSEKISHEQAYARLVNELAVPADVMPGRKMIDHRLASPDRDVKAYHYFGESMFGREAFNAARQLYSLPCRIKNPAASVLGAVGLEAVHDAIDEDLRQQLHAAMRERLGPREVFFSDVALDVALAEQPKFVESDIAVPSASPRVRANPTYWYTTYQAKEKHGVKKVASEIRRSSYSLVCESASDDDLARASCDLMSPMLLQQQVKIQTARLICSSFYMNDHLFDLDVPAVWHAPPADKVVVPATSRVTPAAGSRPVVAASPPEARPKKSKWHRFRQKAKARKAAKAASANTAPAQEVVSAAVDSAEE